MIVAIAQCVMIVLAVIIVMNVKVAKTVPTVHM